MARVWLLTSNLAPKRSSCEILLLTATLFLSQKFKFSAIRDTSQVNPLQYVDRCIHFATVLLASMFEDRSPSQKAEPQEWTQEFRWVRALINILENYCSFKLIDHDSWMVNIYIYIFRFAAQTEYSEHSFSRTQKFMFKVFSGLINVKTMLHLRKYSIRLLTHAHSHIYLARVCRIILNRFPEPTTIGVCLMCSSSFF